MADTPLGWYKWYPRDFLASSTVRKMSYTSQGIYRALLDLQWEIGVPLSYPEATLVLRLSENEKCEFESFFDVCFPNGINAKLMDQRDRQTRAVKAQSEAGKIGGKASGKGRSKVSKGSVRGTSNQTETETETDIVDKSTIGIAVPDVFQTDRGKSAWSQFITYRKEIKKPLTKQAVKLMIGKWEEFSESEVIAAIEESIEKSWRGVFPRHGSFSELPANASTSPYGEGFGIHWGFDPDTKEKEAYDEIGAKMIAGESK